MATPPRKLAHALVPPIGLGCMNLSHAYGQPPPFEAARELLFKALDLGIIHFDSAVLYGFGENERLLGDVLSSRRDELFLVSKCGMGPVDGKRVIDSRPQALRKTLDDSLARLKTDVIDLYYLHRWDLKTPIEESVGAMGEFVQAGKVRAIGLSEVSAETLRAAHAEHPIAAVQSEYSLWSRNAEIAVLDACAELDVAFVAFSPLGRAFLADPALSPAAFHEKDLRRNMPRFQSPHFEENRTLLARYGEIAEECACTPAQLALAWLLQKAPHIHAIPGTTRIDHLIENFGALEVQLPVSAVEAVEALINQDTVSGPRYNAKTQAEIDTEEFAA